MKRTHTKAFKAIVSQYLTDCARDYDGNEFDEQEKAFTHIRQAFESEYNYPQNQQRYPNIQERVKEWLQGLPSACDIACYYSEIIELSEKWHECKLDEKQRDRVCENWFNFMAFHLVCNWRRFELI